MLLNKKGQVSIEVIIMLAILIMGAIVLSILLISSYDKNIDQADDIDSQYSGLIGGFVDDLNNYNGTEQPVILTVATPVASPSGGTYASTQYVSLSTSTPGAEIRYTTNGSNPTPTSGTIYSSAITISSTTTLKARAYKDDMENSSIMSQTYTISTIPQVATPVANPSSGDYTDPINVSLSTTTPDSNIYYTLNGSDPTESSLLYTSQISLSSNLTLKARAYKDGMLPSNILTETYIFDLDLEFEASIVSPEKEAEYVRGNPISFIINHNSDPNEVICSWYLSSANIGFDETFEGCDIAMALDEPEDYTATVTVIDNTSGTELTLDTLFYVVEELTPSDFDVSILEPSGNVSYNISYPINFSARATGYEGTENIDCSWYYTKLDGTPIKTYINDSLCYSVSDPPFNTITHNFLQPGVYLIEASARNPNTSEEISSFVTINVVEIH